MTPIAYESYADPAHEEFPCHTKAATWVSSAYFIENYDKIKEPFRQMIGFNLEKHAQYFGIVPEIQHYVDVVSRKMTEKEAAAPEYMYAIEEQQPDGTVKRAGLISSEARAEEASNWVLSNRNELPLEKCGEIAERILDIAEAGHYTLEKKAELERLVGSGFNDPESIKRQLVKRAKLGYRKSPAASAKMMEMADAFSNNDLYSNPEAMYKMACAVDAYDHQMGLTAARARGDINYPADIFYQYSLSEMQKVASSHVQLQTGETFDLEKLASINKNAFEEEFGTELADELYTGLKLDKEAAAAILPTLPRPQAQQLSVFLSEKNIDPTFTEKAAQAITIPQEIWDYYTR